MNGGALNEPHDTLYASIVKISPPKKLRTLGGFSFFTLDLFALPCYDKYGH